MIVKRWGVVLLICGFSINLQAQDRYRNFLEELDRRDEAYIGAVENIEDRWDRFYESTVEDYYVYSEDGRIRRRVNFQNETLDQGFLEVTAYAFVDLWPTFNPNSDAKGSANPSLIVANLNYVQAKMALEPYEVWIKKQPGVPSAALYQDLEQKKLEIQSLEDTDFSIVASKNDPMLQGTNGALTLGFIVSLVISVIGFLIYWVISIRERTLQFGIYRAIGLSRRSIFGMLVWEQFMISGTAILAGIIIGGLTSDNFVPLLQIVYSAAEQVPPFVVTAYLSDYLKVYAVTIFMLAICLSVLGVIVSRIRIHQAIKLGEE